MYKYVIKEYCKIVRFKTFKTNLYKRDLFGPQVYDVFSSCELVRELSTNRKKCKP